MINLKHSWNHKGSKLIIDSSFECVIVIGTMGLSFFISRMFCMKLRVRKKTLAVAWVFGLVFFGISAENRGLLKADTQLSDKEFFDVLNLGWPGLEHVKIAVDQNDIDQAKAALCNYYRQRGTGFWWADRYEAPSPDDGRAVVDSAQKVIDRVGEFGATSWVSLNQYDWEKTAARTRHP